MVFSLVFPLLWLLYLSRTVDGDLNLYMNETETRRLLGITGELFYIRQGLVNRYALTFNIPLKPDINDIYFNWQNEKKPSAAPGKYREMFYSMTTTVSKPEALKKPTFNIATEGRVPTKQSAIHVHFNCTGTMDADVDVVINMNITIHSVSNITSIQIKRKKACRIKIPDAVHRADLNHRKIDADNDGNISYVYTDAESSRLSSIMGTEIFYIAVGCTCGLILLIAIIVAAYYVRSQKSPHNDRMSETSSSHTHLSHHGQTAYLRADTPNNSVAGLPNMRRAFSPVNDLKPLDVRAILGEIHIERNRVSLGDVLMEGTFGRIYHGVLIGEDENDIESEQDVFIKTVTEQARPDHIETMLRESCMMHGMQNAPNVNGILVACLRIPAQPLLVYPYADQGNLKKFLQKCKMSEIAAAHALSTQQLVYMAIQIIKGIQYLHRKRILHRDIATRNCVVDSNLMVKLTDTALSRDLFPNDYHCLGDNENRPVKWLSIEALIDRRFSVASEVWSFGVTLWELITLGHQPYADIDPFEMSAYLREGYRISQPLNCPDELFAVMACCWALNPDERPKFNQLLVCLQDFYTALGRFI